MLAQNPFLKYLYTDNDRTEYKQYDIQTKAKQTYVLHSCKADPMSPFYLILRINYAVIALSFTLLHLNGRRYNSIPAQNLHYDDQ